MRISGRRYQQKITKALGDGQMKGRQEMADMICDCLGGARVEAANIPPIHNALLYTQAIAEGHRLLAYFYYEMRVEDVAAFTKHFIALRRIS